MAGRMSKILSGKRGKGKSDASHASMSVADDYGTRYSGDGEKSVALTVSSQVTTKASNRRLSPIQQSRDDSDKSSGNKRGWKGFKRLVNGTSPSKGVIHRTHSKSEELFPESKTKFSSLLRRRILSEDGTRRRNAELDLKQGATFSPRVASQLDVAIRGRLDGVDILSLGSVRKTSLWSKKDALSTNGFAGSSSRFGFDPFLITFVGKKKKMHPADLVTEMAVSSGGKDDCEVILEGYFPGGSDRWTVKLSAFGASCDSEHSSSENDRDTLLWDIMWGEGDPPPIPSHMKFSDSDDEDIMTLASTCSVPVDLDEDAFIIDTPEHFRSVQDVATVPLQSKRFDAALMIFEKLLRGLEEQHDEGLRHLQGCTKHNMGLVMMCQGNFAGARSMFTDAVRTRTACLPQNHPDVAVSLVREGDMYFALEDYIEARRSYDLALAMLPTENATRAKVLNAIGAVCYQQERLSEALKAFTSALEIQRQWLDGSVRRESIVYDASITLGNMGKVFTEVKEFDVAYSVFEEACLVSFALKSCFLHLLVSDYAVNSFRHQSFAKTTLYFYRVLKIWLSPLRKCRIMAKQLQYFWGCCDRNSPC